ncbi:MAG: hypothetical protein K9G49_10930 [Taibaiella sp.]|nr:hypothetical protein [Taibaiella sp.]
MKIGIGLFFYILFFVWHAYAFRFKDYVELRPHETAMGIEKPGKEPDVVLSVRDIAVFDIVSFKENPENEWYVVNNRDATKHGFGSEVPSQDFKTLCQSNNTKLQHISIDHFNVNEVTLGRNRLVIVYYCNKWINPLLWPKKRVRYNKIERIELIIPHPFSTTGNYYTLYTKDGEQYQFVQHKIERDKLDKRAEKFGFSVMERKLYA